MKQNSPVYFLISLVMCATLLLALSGCPSLVLSPATPAGLSVGNPTITSLSVSWNSVAEATSYQVSRDTSAGGAFTAEMYDGATASFVDSGLTSGTTYYYKVRAS